MSNSRLRAVLVSTSIAFAFLIFSLVVKSPARAQASEARPLDATVQSPQICGQHATDQGFIDNQGVANSLLAKLWAAQNAVDRNQTDVASNQLEAFIEEVRAQAGIPIEQMRADHMISHAQVVAIQALNEPS